jgi:hypothetical protein
MKKSLLLLMPVFVAIGIVNAQNEGYNWYFSSSPFNSTPAITTSAGSYTLTTVGSGSITVPVSEAVGLGTSCSGPVNVGQFTKPFGLVFSNSPQLVTSSYTIEMVVKLDDINNITYTRLFGFSTGDDGVYISPAGIFVDFADGVTDHPINTTLNAGTWYDLVFVRNGATKDISFYQDGVLKGTYNDAADVFIPQVANSNLITFLKDDVDNTEESSGEVAKLSVYKDTLTPIQITKSFNNVCNTSFQFVAPNFARQGYQWTFGAPPTFNSAPADQGSTGSYPLTPLGTGSIVTLNTPVGLGASCIGNIDVGQYTKPYGFKLTNSPQYVSNAYTIELDVNVDGNPDGVGYIRLIGFRNIDSTSNPDDGVYIDPAGQIEFSENFAQHTITNVVTPIIRDGTTWYHLVFTRDASTKVISYYQNNVLIGTYTDTNDQFVPFEENNYNITFLKDDADITEESSGKIAKASIFNAVLTTAQLQERFDNICNTNMIILPVALKNFNAKKAGRQVELSWTTSVEQNNRGFDVQRSSNGSAFTTIGFVNSVGNTTLETTYHFTDASPQTGKNYYRLRQVSNDNRSTFSTIRLLDMSKDLQDLQLYPNPANTVITIVNIKAGNLLSIYDSQGRSVLTKRATNSQEDIQVEKLSSGVYILQITNSDGTKRSIRFAKF